MINMMEVEVVDYNIKFIYFKPRFSILKMPTGESLSIYR